MSRFDQIPSGVLEKIHRRTTGLAGLGTLRELEDAFLIEARRILPADCVNWNDWSRDLSRLEHYGMTDGYRERFTSLLEPFNEVVSHHPIFVNHQMAQMSREVLRLSDMESMSRFRENPLFREVYRHIDTHYQLAYTASMLRDRQVVLIWNRHARDYSEREKQTFHYLGMQLGVLTKRIEKRTILDEMRGALGGLLDSRMGTCGAAELNTGEATLLTQLLRQHTMTTIARERGVRRDTVGKQFASIREKLGLENQQQLLSALAELKGAKTPTATIITEVR